VKLIHAKCVQKTRGTVPEITAADLSAGTSLRDKLLGTLLLILAAGVFVYLSSILYRSMITITAGPEEFSRFIREQGASGRAAFLGIQVLQGFIPSPFGLTTIAGGYVFGLLQGSLLTISAAMLSTTVLYYLSKIFGRRVLNLFFTPKQQRKVNFFRDEKVRTTLTGFIFLIPGMPKRLFIFSAGIFSESFAKFLAVSTLARIPLIAAHAIGGHALSSGNYFQAVLIFIAAGVFSLAGILFYKQVV
jgi:uncharacterized membrane protein YdjX (TVP38/TMEM64 family)